MNIPGEPIDIDIEAAAVPWKLSAPQPNKPKTQSAHCLRGPIPWSWLKNAIAAGGGALDTGLALWHFRALNKCMKFRASLGQMRKYTALSEKVTRQGLHRLENAGLISVQRPPGRKPAITIVTCESTDP